MRPVFPLEENLVATCIRVLWLDDDDERCHARKLWRSEARGPHTGISTREHSSQRLPNLGICTL